MICFNFQFSILFQLWVPYVPTLLCRPFHHPHVPTSLRRPFRQPHLPTLLCRTFRHPRLFNDCLPTFIPLLLCKCWSFFMISVIIIVLNFICLVRNINNHYDTFRIWFFKILFLNSSSNLITPDRSDAPELCVVVIYPSLFNDMLDLIIFFNYITKANASNSNPLQSHIVTSTSTPQREEHWTVPLPSHMLTSPSPPPSPPSTTQQ